MQFKLRAAFTTAPLDDKMTDKGIHVTVLGHHKLNAETDTTVGGKIFDSLTVSF